MTTPPPRRSIPSVMYDLVLGTAAGFSIGWFTWLISDRLGDESTPPFWPFAVVGVVGTISLVRWARARKGGGRWIHVLWIPVVVFVALMTAVVLALRAWGS